MTKEILADGGGEGDARVADVAFETPLALAPSSMVNPIHASRGAKSTTSFVEIPGGHTC